ncbi:MAG: maleylpyruvate isomerase family mycothiol-dependent enzyme [Actinomycetota bacterium]
MIPTDTIDKLAKCFASLSSLGAQLTEDQWKSPTDCPGWTVQDNLSHLVGIERILNGLPATPHKAAAAAHVKNPIGEANENEIDARRGSTGAEVLAEWNEIATARLATLRSADDAYFAVEAMTPTGPGTVADFLHIRVLDCWVHEQDMRRAVGLPGHLSGPAAEHTIDRLIRTIPIVVGKRAGTPDGHSVVLDITGGVQRHIICSVADGRASIGTIEPEAPLARLTMDTETFLILATGRRAPETLLGEVELAGDVALGNKIVAALNMMI